ncbi:ATP-binding protein [Pedobacter xixiisoli]|uniref:histidine kinase n=1 Tax=Pedobacter xixiisoli TaxID=1476464 RepID=A0A285ZSH8_9SPHI|nr:ATP-binding protein [Pedobacter xixiisoli]SOD12596.1 PAS/PAC sensor signal transduction histidine kinase [Pedobacter xixiisoli]
MKLKTKLRLGIGFLFIILLSFGAISLYQINRISESTALILKDNNHSLQYAKEMRVLIDRDSLQQTTSLIAFKALLKKEQQNITESGEGKAVNELSQALERFLATKNSIEISHIKSAIYQIEDLNMQAIVNKSQLSEKTVAQSTLYLGLAAFIFFVILFTFILSFPGFIANPLALLLDGIQEIGKKNYKQRLHFKGTEEFTQLASAFNDMARKLDSWESSNVAELKSEKLRIETIIEQMQDAVIGIDERERIIFLNQPASNVLHLDTSDVVGKTIEEVTNSNHLLKTIITKTNSELLQIVLNDKPNYFSVESNDIAIPQIPDDETVISFTYKTAGRVFILKNVTDFKELDQAKTNFMATISHELKTPIASIKMSLKLLEDSRIGELNTEQQNMVNHIQDDTSRLLKITGELLDLAQVETGNIKLNVQQSDAKEILDYAVNAVKLQTQQKEIELKLTMPANLPPLLADQEKTAWVLVNFLSNAIRYSSNHSKIDITITEQQKMLNFSVRDYGKGIADEYKNNLFKRYFQVPTDGQHKSGSGLGLSISKDFIAAQQGEIWVESELGAGSTFSFSLPKSIVQP